MKNNKEQLKDFQWAQKEMKKEHNNFESINNISISKINQFKNEICKIDKKGGRPKKSITDKKVQYTLKINPVLNRSIKDYVSKTGLSITAAIEQALIEFFKDQIK